MSHIIFHRLTCDLCGYSIERQKGAASVIRVAKELKWRRVRVGGVPGKRGRILGGVTQDLCTECAKGDHP